MKIIMKNTQVKTQNELDKATTEYFSWKDSALETRADYNERIKKIKLIKIMNEITKNELTENQKEIMKLKFFKHYKQEEIAKIMDVSPSSVTRTIQRIEVLIKENMKYALMFADMDDELKEPPIDIMKSFSLIVGEKGEISNIGERLKRVRMKKGLSEKQLSLGAGVSEKKIEDIENGKDIKLSDFTAIIFFLSVGADEIIFGV